MEVWIKEVLVGKELKKRGKAGGIVSVRTSFYIVCMKNSYVTSS